MVKKIFDHTKNKKLPCYGATYFTFCSRMEKQVGICKANQRMFT